MKACQVADFFSKKKKIKKKNEKFGSLMLLWWCDTILSGTEKTGVVNQNASWYLYVYVSVKTVVHTFISAMMGWKTFFGQIWKRSCIELLD